MKMLLVRRYFWYHLPTEVDDCEDMRVGLECLGHHDFAEEIDESQVSFCESCGGSMWDDSETTPQLVESRGNWNKDKRKEVRPDAAA